MKILHILPESPVQKYGGLGVTVEELAKVQAAEGHEVICLGHDFVKNEFEVLGHLGYTIYHVGNYLDGTERTFQEKRKEVYLCTYLEHLSKISFDVVHLHDPYLYPLVKVIRLLHPGVRVIGTWHLSFQLEHAKDQPEPYHIMTWEEAQACYHNDDKFRRESQIELCFMNGVDVLTTCSKAYAEKLRDWFGFNRPIYVVPNGVNYLEIANTEPEWDDWDWAKDKFRVLFCGRPVPGKGFDLVLDAAEALPDIAFYIVSKVHPSFNSTEGYMENYRKRIAELPNVKLLDNLPIRGHFGLMKTCDAVLVPSINESPFEIAGLEAMAAGVVLITTAVCGMREYCTEENSFIIEPNAQGLIDEVLKLCKWNIDKRCKKLSTGEYTAKQFQWKQTKDLFDSLYCERNLENNAYTLSTFNT
ncbi:MAG: glycosyltransferase family 4 protein [Cyanobacteria bacterium]|nr:glycosyltransferase family 4 protein [Cyanobacteriota bacterium]